MARNLVSVADASGGDRFNPVKIAVVGIEEAIPVLLVCTVACAATPV